MGRVRRDAPQWQEIFERYRASGQRVVDFCQTEGLALSTFQRWKQALRTEVLLPSTKRARAQERGAVSATPLFAALSVPEAAHQAEPVTASTWRIELDLGAGIRLTLH